MKKEIIFFFKQVLFALFVMVLLAVLGAVLASLVYRLSGISLNINLKGDQLIIFWLCGVYIKRLLNKKKFDL